MKKIKDIRYYRNLLKIKKFLNELGVSLASFLLPAFLALVAAGFVGITTILLLTITKGIISGDFSFVRETRFLKIIPDSFPHLFTSYAAIFSMLLGGVLISLILKNFFQYFSRLRFAYQIRKFTDNLRRAIFDRYLTFGKLFFDRANTGYLNNVLLGFTHRIGWEVVHLQNLLIIFLMLIVYIAIMFWISWKLTILTMIIFPVFNYSLKWIIEKLKKTSLIYSDREGFMSEKAYNILSCIPLVKVYNREEEEKKEFAGISKNVKEIEYSMDKKHIIVNPLQEIITFIAVALLISYIAFETVKGRSREISTLLVFFYTLKKASNLFGVFGFMRVSMATIEGPIRKILKVFSDKGKFFVVSGKKAFEGLKESIEINDLVFSYISEIKVLKNVNVSIEKGKMTAIVGETGGGKTTLINLLMRFYDCSPQAIKIDGIDIRKFSAKSLRASMSLVSQDALLFNDTLKNNILYGLREKITDERLLEVLKRARLYDFVMGLPDGLDTYTGDRGVKLSGGEKQRVAIARAVLKGSEILILDEATSSLDSITEHLIQEAINEVVKNKTVIVIAHRLSTIRNADKIVVMENGRIIEEGALRELLDKKGKFYEYWEAQKFY